MKHGMRYVQYFKDRHGKERWYFRHRGTRFPLPDPGPLSVPSPEFMARYQEMAEGRFQTSLTSIKRKLTDKGLIYVVGYADYVKIGYTTDLKKRLVALQTSCPEKLRVLHTFPGLKANEGAMHKSFQRSRMNGEWFRLSGPIAEWIDEQRLRACLPHIRSMIRSPSPPSSTGRTA